MSTTNFFSPRSSTDEKTEEMTDRIFKRQEISFTCLYCKCTLQAYSLYSRVGFCCGTTTRNLRHFRTFENLLSDKNGFIVEKTCGTKLLQNIAL